MTESIQVLLLEDRAKDAELVVRELEKAGFKPDWQRVETERDFALRLVPNLDLILSDYTLPGFTALRAIELLQASRLDIPLIVVSGSLGDEQAVECLRKGAVDYLLKDRLARLGSAVRRALSDRRNRLARATAELALKQSEEQMRGVLSTVEDTVFSISLPGNGLNYMNPAGEKLFGRSLEEFFHDPQLWVQCVHPEDRSRMVDDQKAAIRWGTGESRFRVARSDKSIRHVVSRVWCAYADGKPIRLEGIVTDVTDKMRAEEERLELELSRREGDRLRQVNEFKSQFLNMVAHDLNNVLSPITTAAQLLAGPLAEGLQPPQEKAVDLMKNGVRRLSGFLADLLDASRLQSGKLTITAAPFDISEQVRNTVMAIEAEAEEKRIQIRPQIVPNVRIIADARRIEQVVTNLLNNALKFTPPNGTIEIGVDQDAQGTRITVANSGPGISPQDLGKLFQPFSQLGPAMQGKHTGSGLGLFICKGIVEGHGGTISGESPGPGKGATFRVRLPTAPGTPAHASKAGGDVDG
jgi:PAS domain S-box-containing protein